MDNDVEDLRIVVAYLSQTYGYHVDLIIAHSRGSTVGFRWMCTLNLAEGERPPSGYVNLSARYRMKVCFLARRRYRMLILGLRLVVISKNAYRKHPLLSILLSQPQ